MFTVYHSNQLDLLKSLVAGIIERSPNANPFEPETILVQSHGMAQWLQLELAQQFGIAANLQFPLPASFIWQMYSTVLPGIPKESAFHKMVMTWNLMTLLPQMANEPEFKSLAHYLTDDTDKRKHYQLSAKVADLFDQYLVYRPDWLTAWQKGEMLEGLGADQAWQAPLWKNLVDGIADQELPHWHRANLHRSFIDALATQPKGSFANLPQRVFICGIAALPPAYLDAFQALGQHMDVHLMFTNPCRYYWGDIQDYGTLAKLQARRRKHYQKEEDVALFANSNASASLFNDAGEQQLSNPLLASFGKLGRDHLSLMTELAVDNEIDAFVDLPSERLLHRIQQDILDLKDRAIVGNTLSEFEHSREKMRLAADDNSISFHVCHSAQREVEILYDNMLALLEKSGQEDDVPLQPQDIIVMVADIDRYTPYIQAVFGNAPKERYLPFAISDRSAKELHPILKAFLLLLNLPESRFKSEEILELLEVRALAETFGFDESALQTLREWVDKSGIRWGLDEQTFTDFELPTTGQNTWTFGVNRMLLGYAMESEAGDWAGILPFDESSGLVGELAGQLARFLSVLSQWRTRLAQLHTLDEWLPLCQALLEDFFVRDSETEALLMLVESQWQQVIHFGQVANYQEAVPLTLLRDEMQNRLAQERISQRFLAGMMNFCTLMPMRSIPFKVVCLLGMNDGIYPRTIEPLGFDLMAQQPKKGDRSRRDDDRYLFLEAILSAQQYLYISYIGFAIQDNKTRYSSVLVNELIEYIAQSHVLDGDEALDIDKSAAAVQAHLLQQHCRMPFDARNFIAGERYQSYATQWLPAALGEGEAADSFIEALAPLSDTQIDFDALHRFYRHPVRAFFRERLKVSFRPEEDALADEEPFHLDYLDQYLINNRLLTMLIKEEDEQAYFQQLKSAGKLPYGAYGELFWQQQCETLLPIAQQVQAQGPLGESQSFTLNIDDDTQLYGWLHHVNETGVLHWKAANLTAIDGLSLWLDHLVFCALGRQGVSQMYGKNETQWCFKALDEYQAIALLKRYIEGYRKGLSEPLLLMTKSGWAWLTSCFDETKQQLDESEEIQEKAHQAFLNVLEGNYSREGECQDDYYQRVFESPNEAEIKEIKALATTYLMPLLIYRESNG